MGCLLELLRTGCVENQEGVTDTTNDKMSTATEEPKSGSSVTRV